MPDTLSAIDLRRWATQCAQKADDVNRSAEERDRLLRMHASLWRLRTARTGSPASRRKPSAPSGKSDRRVAAVNPHSETLFRALCRARNFLS